MIFFKIFIYTIILCFFCTSAHSHNPDDFVISEIEQGQLIFENELIASEYNAALKRMRIRKLESMSFQRKSIIFTKAGFEHIIPKGLDHILFVLGLFFSSLRIGPLLWQVTAFTIAHSITLILAGLGIFYISGAIVEPLIALSIIWIAIENCLFKKPSKSRFIVVFLFGLLHGLGFASMISQYGLPKDNLISLLLAFNIGVEIGQLTILIIAYLIVKNILNKIWQSDKIRIPVSIIIGLTGLFWLTERIMNI